MREPDGSIYPSARRVPSITEAVGHAFLQPFDPDNRLLNDYFRNMLS